MAKKKTKLEKMSKDERTSLAYALATNLAKHGKPQTPQNERKLSKGEENKKEKHIMKFKKAFNLKEMIKTALKNPINEGRIDQSKIFDQSEVDKIIGEIREITGILEDGYRSDVGYSEYRFKDGTGGFSFQWTHGRNWGGRFGLSIGENGNHKLTAISWYDDNKFGSEDIKSSNTFVQDVTIWEDLDNSSLISIWAQLQPLVKRNEVGAKEALNREAKNQEDYYKSKNKSGRIGYGLSSQPRSSNRFEESVNEAEFKHISSSENKIKDAIKDVEKKFRLKANRDNPPQYAQLSLNKIMLSKVLGREELGKEHQGAWKKLKKEYNLKEVELKEGLPKGFWDKNIKAKDEDQDGKVDEVKTIDDELPKDWIIQYGDAMKKAYGSNDDTRDEVDESYATLVNKIEKSGKGKKAAKAIAGAVASYKAKGGGKGPTAKQK